MASYTGGEVRVFEYNTTSDNIVYITHAAQHTMNYTTDTLSVGSVVRSFSDIISIFMIEGVKIIILKNTARIARTTLAQIRPTLKI